MEGVLIILGVIGIDAVPGERDGAITLLLVIGKEGESTKTELVLVSSDSHSAFGVPL